MAEISDLFSPTEQLAITFPTGAKLTITYLREEVTSTLVDPNSKDPQVLAGALCHIIRDWDLTRDGVPVPLGVDAVAGLHVAFQQYVFKAIIRDQDVDPK